MAPMWMALRKPNASTTTHSQVVLRKKSQPARRSANVPGDCGVPRCRRRDPHAEQQGSRDEPGEGIHEQRPAGAHGDHEQRRRPSAREWPGCRAPATSGRWPAAAGRAARAAASRSRSPGTTSPTAVRGSALSTMTIQSSAAPVITSSAMAAWSRPEKMLETWMTSVRGKRSAITPPQSRNTHLGIVCAASTWPRAVAESAISSTANASAMGGHRVAEGVGGAGREVPAEVPLAKRGRRVLPRHAGHPTTAARRMVKRVPATMRSAGREESKRP